MRVPFLTNRVGDMVIHALRAGGYLADDLSANKIRSVDNDISEADMINLAVGLNYGSTGSSSGILSSKEDVYIFVDSDNTNPTTPYTNYLRVVKGQLTSPVTDPYRDLYAIGSESGPDSDTTICRIGPDAKLIGIGDDFPAELQLGVEYNGTSPKILLKIKGDYSGGSEIISRGDLAIESSLSAVNIAAKGSVILRPSNVASVDGLSIKANSADKTVTFSNFDNFTEHSVLFNGYTTAAKIRVGIGGASGVQREDPGNLLIGAGYPGFYSQPYNQPTPHTSSLHIVAADQDKRCTLSTWHKGTSSTLTDGAHLVNFHSNINFKTASEKVRMLSVTGFYEANREVAFEVRADRSCYGFFFTTTGMDLAESFPSALPAAEVIPGTVMSMGNNGKAIVSYTSGDTCVIGVVSTQPGMTLGDHMPEESVGDTVEIAMSGTVPVRCNTSGGSIKVGDLLVSAGEGMARKAWEKDPPGSKIGKALEELESSCEFTTGLIKMLVFHS